MLIKPIYDIIDNMKENLHQLINNQNKKNKYRGPILSKKDLHLPFWDQAKTKPLGGCLKAQLVHVIDGDTAVYLVDGVKETVRSFIIDTKEIYPEVQPYGLEAKAFVNDFLQNASQIYLQSDIHDNLRDNTSSKRLLAWIWVDGILLNYLLVQLGFASVKYVNSEKMKYLKALKKAQKRAIKAKRRIFKDQ